MLRIGALLLLAVAANWPGWRGPLTTGHVPDGVAVPATLPAEPKILWQIKVGDGLSSPVVSGGKVFHLENQQGKETVHALDADTGKELWQAGFDVIHKDSQSPAGPRCTPLVDGDRVYVQSCRGELRCLRVADGRQLWGVSYTKDFAAVFNGEVGNATGASRHGYSGAPIVDGDRLIAGVGGTNGASVVCFNKLSGAVIWKSQSDIPGYTGPIVATLAGKKQVVAFTATAVIGLDAGNGALLWREPVKTNFGRHVTTPVVAGDLVLVSSHQEGLIAIRVTQAGAIRSWTKPATAINFASFVVIGDYLYGLGPSKKLICVDARTGELQWANADQMTGPSGKSYAGFIAMGDKLLVLTDSGRLLLLAADPKQCRVIASAQVCGQNWCNPAYVDGKLYLRDAQELRCIQLLP